MLLASCTNEYLLLRYYCSTNDATGGNFVHLNPLFPFLWIVLKVRTEGAYRALCARCAKSRPFSTTGRQFFGCRIAAGYYCRCVSL